MKRIIVILALLVPMSAVAADVYKMNPHTGKLDNTGPGHTVLNKVGIDVGGKPTWDGAEWPGETQITILDKLAMSTDGAVLVLTQGPTEADNAPRIQIRHRDGTVTSQINTDGTFFFNQGLLKYGTP